MRRPLTPAELLNRFQNVNGRFIGVADMNTAMRMIQLQDQHKGKGNLHMAVNAKELTNPKECRERRGVLLDQMQQLIDAADGEMTSDERAVFYSMKANASALLDRAEYLELQEAHAASRLPMSNAILPVGSLGNAALPTTTEQNRGPLNQQPTGMQFRDAATGAVVRAVSSRERLSNERPEVSVGEQLCALLTGNFRNSAQFGSSDSGGGFLLTPTYSQTIMDLARSAMVTVQAGAQTVPMGGAELHLVKIDSDPEAHWRAETVPVPASQFSFGKITLRPKTLACLIPVSLELLEDASNAAAVIEEVMRSAMGLAMDRAVLTGTGAESQPRGILNQAGVNAITGVGTPASYAKVTEAVGDILAANYPGEVSALSWAMNPRDAETFDALVDLQGQPKQPTPWAASLKKLHTTSLPSADGGGGNESSMIVGDFSQVLIGMRTTGVVVQILDSGQVTDADGKSFNAASQLMRFIRCYARMDVAVMRPTWLTKLTGVTA